MATVQMNTRLDEDVKRRGDEVFARGGFTPSQVVRIVWGDAASTGEVPAYLLRAAEPQSQDRLARVREGAGLALRVARERCGFKGGGEDMLQDRTWRDIRDGMYEARLDDLHADGVI